MKIFYHNLNFLLIIVLFVMFYLIAIKPIITTYLEGFQTKDFTKFYHTITKRFTLNIF